MSSHSYELEDAFAANELFQDNGWTDGLPIVLAVVRAMCAPELGQHGTSASTGGSAQFSSRR